MSNLDEIYEKLSDGYPYETKNYIITFKSPGIEELTPLGSADSIIKQISDNRQKDLPNFGKIFVLTSMVAYEHPGRIGHIYIGYLNFDMTNEVKPDCWTCMFLTEEILTYQDNGKSKELSNGYRCGKPTSSFYKDSLPMILGTRAIRKFCEEGSDL